MAISPGHFYHYNNGEAIKRIIREERLDISKTPRDNTRYYLTDMTPDHHDDATLLASNCAGDATDKGKPDVEFYIKFSKKKLNNMELKLVPTQLYMSSNRTIDLVTVPYAVGRRHDGQVKWEIASTMLKDDLLIQLIPEIANQSKEAGRAGAHRMPALGRRFKLGSLYNYRTEQLIDEELWDNEAMKDWIHNTKSTEGWKHKPFTGGSVEAKMHVFDIDFNLKLSILSGLMSPTQGSAKYLCDDTSSNKTARAGILCTKVVQYKGVKTDNITKVPATKRRITFEKDATHVVTGIEYGLQALYTFEKDIEEGQKIDEAAINLSGHVAARFKTEDAPHEEIDDAQLDWECFGDQPHPKKCSTIEASVHHFKEWTQTCDEDTEKIPVAVWLTPLDFMHINEVLRVSESTVRDIQAILEDLAAKNVQCDDLLKSDVCNHSQKIHDDLEKMRQLISKFTKAFKGKVASLLPEIRGNAIDEKELSEMVNGVKQSPFMFGHLTSWLERQTKTVRKFETYVRKLHTIPFGQVDVGKKKPLVCFKFFEEVPKDDCLAELDAFSKKYEEPALDAKVTGNGGLYTTDTNHETKLNNVAEEDCHTADAQDCDDTDKRIDRFLEFYENNKENRNLQFLASFPNEDNGSGLFGSTISYYNSGELVHHNFELPSQVEAPTEDTDSRICIRWKEPDCARVKVKRYLVECTSGGDSRDPQETAQTMTALSARRGQDYTFRVRTVSNEGYFGPYGKVSNPMQTLQSAGDTKNCAVKLVNAKEKVKNIKLENRNLVHSIEDRDESIEELKKGNKALKDEIDLCRSENDTLKVERDKLNRITESRSGEPDESDQIPVASSPESIEEQN